MLIDSGASAHAVSNPTILENSKTISSSDDPFYTASGEKLSVTHIGDIGEIKNIACLPNLNSSIVSVGQLCDQFNRVVSFDRHQVIIGRHDDGERPGGIVVGRRARRNGLYYLGLNQLRSAGTKLAREINMLAPTSLKLLINPLNLIHARCGHSGITTILFGIKHGLFKDSEKYSYLLKDGNFDFCSICATAKMRAKPHVTSESEHPEDVKGSHFSVDLCSPMSVESAGGKKYFMVLIDRFTRRGFIYFLRGKDDAVNVLTEFLAEIRATLGVITVRIVRSDNGGEFTSDAFKLALKSELIWHELTQPYSPEQNGIAERMNGKILSMTRCLLRSANAPKFLWAEAAQYAMHIWNCLPHSANPGKITPMEAWNDVKPQLDELFVWGSPAFVRIPAEKRVDKKLDDVAMRGMIVGLSRDRKCYRVYIPAKHKIIESSDVEIDEYALLKDNSFTNGNGGNKLDINLDRDDSVLTDSLIVPNTIEPPAAAAATTAKALTSNDDIIEYSTKTENVTPEKKKIATPSTKVQSPVTDKSTSPTLPESTVPKFKLEELEEMEEKAPVQEKELVQQPRRSARVNKGIPAEKFEHTYENEKETAWRKKHGME